MPRSLSTKSHGELVADRRVSSLDKATVPGRLGIGRLVEGGLGCRGAIDWVRISALLHGDDGCSGHEGDTNDEHLHYHADEALIRDRGRFGEVGLAVLVGLNPCVLVVPVALTAAPSGGGALAAVFLAYGIPAVASMVLLAALGARLSRLIYVPGAARHMEMISGLLIAALGFAIWFWPHH